MHVRRGRYIGVAPVPGGLTNVCLVKPSGAGDAALRDPAGAADARARARSAAARSRRRRAARSDRPSCSGRWPSTSATRAIDGLLLAGDAAGFIDPMTGDGLRFAVRGGELAARAALQRARARLDRRPRAARRRAPPRVRRQVAVQPRAARARRVAARHDRGRRRRAPGAFRCSTRSIARGGGLLSRVATWAASTGTRTFDRNRGKLRVSRPRRLSAIAN